MEMENKISSVREMHVMCKQMIRNGETTKDVLESLMACSILVLHDSIDDEIVDHYAMYERLNNELSQVMDIFHDANAKVRNRYEIRSL